MIKPKKLKKGDKVAVVSLSSGMLGEDYCKHYLGIGVKRLEAFGLSVVFMPNSLKGVKYLEEHPEARAEDLKMAFADDSIKAVICAIGGEDTFRLTQYLLEDKAFVESVRNSPKIFTGFSDTTINHLLFYKLGMVSYYGPNYINDFSEVDVDMLTYTKNAVKDFYFGQGDTIASSKVWYEERTDFSPKSIGTSRIVYEEKNGYELLKGDNVFEGELLGGCVESLYDLLVGERYNEEKFVNEKYGLFPELNEWKGKILFLETSEEQREPQKYEQMLSVFKDKGIFEVINGIIVGKPQNEVHYEAYKEVLCKVTPNGLPILYNVNFGHAYPRTVLAYGVKIRVDASKGQIKYLETITG